MPITTQPHPTGHLLFHEQAGIPLCLGTDLVYLPRIEKIYLRHDKRFLQKVLTPQEIVFCTVPAALKVKIARIASRIAVKEAVLKALAIGISTMGNPAGTVWNDVEVLRKERQAPTVALHGKALTAAKANHVAHWLVSTSHDGDYATATVIGLKPETVSPPTTTLSTPLAL